MALVAYDYDSDSENDEQDDPISDVEPEKANTNVTDLKPTNKVKLDFLQTKTKSLSPGSTIFSSLPQKKSATVEIVEDQIEDFIPKSKPVVKEKQKVKISIPSLSQFKDNDDEEPQSKKSKSSTKCSGLMSLLPPVKGSVTTTKSFVPNVVANKHKNSNINISNRPAIASLIPDAVRAKADARKTVILSNAKHKKPRHGSDSDDDIDIPETFDDEIWQKVCGRPTPKQIIQETDDTPPQETIDIAPEPEKPYDGLDNNAFKQLVGKTKRPMGNIKLIDINEEEILPEKDLWMTKSLTDPEFTPKPQVEDPVDPTRRKKHHITYLAQQAKANEQELQNSWSASKNNRMATRAKYGF